MDSSQALTDEPGEPAADPVWNIDDELLASTGERRRVADAGAMYREAFEGSVVPGLDPGSVAEVRTVARHDTIFATRRAVLLDVVRTHVQNAYYAVERMAVFFPLLPWAVLEVTDGPVWLRVVLLLVAAGTLLLELLPERAWGDPSVVLGVAGLGCVIALFFWPAGRLGVWSGLGAVGGTCVAALIVIALANSTISRWATPSSSVLVLGVACVGGYWAFRYRDLHDSVDTTSWWEFGLALGLLLGAVVAAVLAALQFGLAMFTNLRRLGDFRIHPEAVFTQRALQIMTRDPDDRFAVVSDTEYLALVLERGVGYALRREDPASADSIRTELGMRAARLRALKRQVLFGRPGAQEALLGWLDDAVLAATRRDWLALPIVEPGDETAGLARPTRVGRKVVHVFVFLLPVILLGVVWVSGVSLDPILPAALPFTVIWMGVQLAELAVPGSAEELSTSASAAGGTSSVLAPFLHILLPGK